ncbi:MAG TPA: hypothetical protein VFQ98_02855 [Gallionella sp.]|nr:hypothetical protein [Gallionella sp.]
MKTEIKEIVFNVEANAELARAFNIESTDGLPWVYLACIAEAEETHILNTITKDSPPKPAISLREYLAGKEINSLLQAVAG